MDRIYKMMKRNNKGFTLVELMVVLVIIGILVAIAIPIFNKVQLGAAQRAHDANLRTIDGAVMMYYAENSKYPSYDELTGEYIEEGLTVPEKLQDEYTWDADYGLSGDTPPKAAPGGSWTGAYNKDATIASVSDEGE